MAKIPTKFFRRKPMIDEPEDLPVIQKSFNWVRFIILILIFAGISTGLYLALKNSWKEVGFAIKNPEIVREVRQLYVSEHENVNKEILLRQRMTLPIETEQASELKKE